MKASLGAVALLGCGCGSGLDTARAVPAPAPEQRSALGASKHEEDVDSFPGELARALELVGRVRELAPQRAVAGKVIDRTEMVARVKLSMRSEVPPEVIEAQEEMLFALHVVPADFEYERSILELVEDQLAGFYEPKDRSLYLAGDLAPAARWATLAHELVHALQDQHYDLGSRVEYREDGTDAQSAIHALAEGDATSAMFDILQGRPATTMSEMGLGILFRGSAVLGTGGEVPSLLKRSLIAPYVDGIGLVHWARRQGGWAAVDEIWRRPPASTEQVLHPEKWVSGEEPLRVSVPEGPGSSWRLVYRDVLGEQSLRLLFEEWMPRFRAEEGAAGWGGDEVALYESERGYGLAWRLVFDDVTAAQGAAVAFARGVLQAGRAGAGEGFEVTQAQAEEALRGGVVCVERAEQGPFAVAWNGTAIGVVGGPYLRAADGSAQSAASCKSAAAWVSQVARALTVAEGTRGRQPEAQ